MDSNNSIPEGLTAEQQEIIANDFQLTEEAAITDEEARILVDVFDSPEKLVLLRKLFYVVSTMERGISMKANVPDHSSMDFEQFGKEMAFMNEVNSRIQQAMVQAYMLVMEARKTDKTEAFKEKNEADAKRAEQTKKLAEEAAEANMKVGPNV